MRCLVLQGDQFGCYAIRIDRPFRELIRYGIEMESTPLLPGQPETIGPNFDSLMKLIEGFDLVILQRILELNYVKYIRQACFLQGKPMIHETDDDYLHLDPHNPCYFSTALGDPLLETAREYQMTGNNEELNKIMPQLNEIRKAGLEGYKQSLALYDAITVTTEELRQVLLPYNKNIFVLPNQMARCYFERDYTLEESDEAGRMKKFEKFGMVSTPAYFYQRNEKNELIKDQFGMTKPKRVCRIGYSGTLSHRTDFETIAEGWDKLVDKWAPSVHFIYIGDPYFYHRQRSWTGIKSEENPEGDGRMNRRMYIPETAVDTYLLNLRNLDIGIAPLEPTIFNMSKSDLKAMEYAAWGICPVLPKYITYTRAWKHGETCFFYSNSEELYKIIDMLIQNPAIREKVGRNAQKYVFENRLEKQHTQRRAQVYHQICQSKTRFFAYGRKKNAA